MRRDARLPHPAAFAVIVATLWMTAVVVRSATEEMPQAPSRAAVATSRSGSQATAKKTSATTRVRKPVDWAALNPAFKDATYVNDRKACLDCHEDVMRDYDHTVHAASLSFATDASKGGDCETCHGPRSKHVEDGADATDVLSHAKLSPGGQSAVCLQCHEGGAQVGFKTGPHHSAEVSCSSCHTVMAKKSERALLAKSTSTQLCYACHSEVRAETLKTSHHPVREGKMDCASCHNPHASTEALLVKNTINETCATCHTPHGSSNRFLLASREPFLCLSCHSYGGHINLPRYNRTSNSYGNGCTNCHITTHGSNHPSGAKQTR